MAQASITNLQAARTVAAQYDFAIHGGAVGAILLRVKIPKGAVVYNAFGTCLTAFTSAASTATIAVSIEGANDVFTAAAVSGAPWSTTGSKLGIPDAATVGDWIITTAERELTLTIAVQAVTAGKANIYIQYVCNQTA